MLEEAPVGHGGERRNERVLDPTKLNPDLVYAALLGPVFCTSGYLSRLFFQNREISVNFSCNKALQ
jgi:hypothetical protein